MRATFVVLVWASTGCDAPAPVPAITPDARVVPAGVRVNAPDSVARCPALAATDRGLVVVWREASEGDALASNLLDSSHVRTGEDQRIVSIQSEPAQGCPSTVTDGSVVTVAFSSTTGIGTVQLDADGALLAGPTVAIDTSVAAVTGLAAAPSGYALVWDSVTDGGDDRTVHAQRLDATLAPVGPTQMLAAPAYNNEGPSVLARPDGFTVAWYGTTVFDGEELRGVVVQAVDDTMLPTGAPHMERGHGINTTDEPTIQATAQLAAGGQGAAMAWRVPGTIEQVGLRVFDAEGVPQGGIVPGRIPTGYKPAPTLTGSPDGFFAAWHVRHPAVMLDDERSYDVAQYVRFDENGDPRGEIGFVEGSVVSVAVGFDGSSYVLVVGDSLGGLYVQWLDP